MTPPRRARVAVLASGRGSNFQALHDALVQGRLDVDLVGVFSDRARAGVLERAHRAGVPATVVRPADHPDRAAHDESLFSAIEGVQPDLIVCAGYMRLISAAQVDRFRGRMLNIHPSLLPDYPGLDTHSRAIAEGRRMHGCSVHFVIPALDAGPVIAQARVPVLGGDDPSTLAQRVLGVEHPLLVAAVRLVASGRVALRGDRVEFEGRPLAAPLQLGPNEELELEATDVHPPDRAG